MLLREAVEREELALRALVRAWESLPANAPNEQDDPKGYSEYADGAEKVAGMCNDFLKKIGLAPDAPEESDMTEWPEEAILPVFVVYETAVSFDLSECGGWYINLNPAVVL